MRRFWLIPLLVVVAACGAGGETASTASTEVASTDTTSPATTTTTTECPPAAPERTTHRYATTDGVPANAQSLDVYPAPGCGPHPALLWVHGGGWRVGDKRNQPVEQKAAWAAEHGWTLIGVNYRLTKLDNDVRWPDHGEDVAAATAWVIDHAAEIGVDPAQIALMGHSAGGHLVAIVAADPELIGATGHDRDEIDCVVALDGAGYDLEARSEGSPRFTRLRTSVFGDDPAVLAGASPTLVLEDEGGPVADFLIVTRGEPSRQAIAGDLGEAVESAGSTAEVLDARGYSHADVNDAVGAPDEDVVTPAVEGFLDDCFPSV